MSVVLESPKASIDSSYKLYIDGKWVEGTSGKTIKSYNRQLQY